MLSLRNLARAVPRTLSRPSSQVATRSFTALRKPSQLQQTWRLATVSRPAAFSSAVSRWAAKEGSTDEELSAKFAEELQLEKESTDSEELPSHLKEYLDSTPFQVEDIAGQEEVVLTRSFGNEKIRVSFTIADLSAIDHDPDAYSQDRAMYDAGDDAMTEGQSGGAQSKGTINQGKTAGGNFNVAPEDSVAPGDREELMDDEGVDAEPSFPSRLNITIEKDGVAGALQFEAIAHDGSISIENVYHYSNKELADVKTAEQDWSRKSIYTGPPYGNLDEDLQVLLERYLEERGLDTRLAVWVPEYIDFKEQKEYMKWLSDAKTFIDA